MEKNPCVEYVQYIILPWFGAFTVERDEANGGNKTYTKYEELVEDYKARLMWFEPGGAAWSPGGTRPRGPGCGLAFAPLFRSLKRGVDFPSRLSCNRRGRSCTRET